MTETNLEKRIAQLRLRQRQSQTGSPIALITGNNRRTRSNIRQGVD